MSSKCYTKLLKLLNVTANSSINPKEGVKQNRTSVTARQMQSLAARVLQRQHSGFHFVSSRLPSTAFQP